MKRREFLSTLTVAALGATAPGAFAQEAATSGKRLVVIFLRGGVDGLSAVVPSDDPWYFRARPTISLPPPGQEGGTLPLVQGFGLHPALEPLLEPWRAGTLALIPACGLPTPIRTHPEAQRAMESGDPTEQHPHDGWLGRLMPLLGRDAKAVTLSSVPPLIGQGRPGADNVRPSGYPPSQWLLERPAVFKFFDEVYHNNDPMSKAYQQAQIVLRNKLTELDREITVSAGGAPSVHALPTMAGQIASYLEKNPAVRLFYVDLGGFDAHFEQGTGKGRLAEVFYSLGKGVAELVKVFGPGLEDTMVLFMSEFGRSLRENEFAGTDNGHGTLFMVLGGGVAGGGLHGPWPGLAPEKLSDGLDLAAAVDFREVISQIVLSYFGLSLESLAQVFPGYALSGTLKGLFNTLTP
jgi:uncharacterized protein (DUF1501 family)